MRRPTSDRLSSVQNGTRKRRHGVDVGRRDRIAQAALAVIGKKGVAGLTHRAVAALADVPLGSTTYHFASLDDIVAAAFTMAMDADLAKQAAWAAGLTHESDIPAVLADLVIEQAATRKDDLFVNYELTLAAVHRPQLHALADSWITAIARALAPFVGEAASETAAAVYEGTLLRLLISGGVPNRDRLLEQFRRACQAD